MSYSLHTLLFSDSSSDFLGDSSGDSSGDIGIFYGPAVIFEAHRLMPPFSGKLA